MIYNFKDIENEFGISLTTAQNRFRALNIKGVKREFGKKHFTYDEVYKILYFKKLLVKHDLLVIEFYLNNKNNTLRDISNALGLPMHYISICIESYFNERCVIVESKLNNPDFVL